MSRLLGKRLRAGSGEVMSVSNPCGSTSMTSRFFLYAVYYICKYARIMWGFVTHPTALFKIFRRRRIPKDKRSLYFYAVLRARSGQLQPASAKYYGDLRKEDLQTRDNLQK